MSEEDHIFNWSDVVGLLIIGLTIFLCMSVSEIQSTKRKAIENGLMPFTDSHWQGGWTTTGGVK